MPPTVVTLAQKHQELAEQVEWLAAVKRSRRDLMGQAHALTQSITKEFTSELDLEAYHAHLVKELQELNAIITQTVESLGEVLRLTKLHKQVQYQADVLRQREEAKQAGKFYPAIAVFGIDIQTTEGVDDCNFFRTKYGTALVGPSEVVAVQ